MATDKNKKIENKIYVGNVPFGTTEDDLREQFKFCGKIKTIEIPTEEDSDRELGYAYIEFATAKAAQKAVETQHGEEFGEESKKRRFKVNIFKESRCRGRW